MKLNNINVCLGWKYFRKKFRRYLKFQDWFSYNKKEKTETHANCVILLFIIALLSYVSIIFVYKKGKEITNQNLYNLIQCINFNFCKSPNIEKSIKSFIQ